MPNMLPSSKDLPPIQFSTGQVVATPGALRLLEQHGVSPHQLVSRHVRCDYGSVPAEDATANNDALIHSGRVLSSYPVGGGCVWVITVWDHALTTSGFCQQSTDELFKKTRLAGFCFVAVPSFKPST